MRAALLTEQRRPLREVDIPIPVPTTGQVLIRVDSCAVCRTDLHVLDGDLEKPKLPLVLGHEIVGVVEKLGGGATRFSVGDRVGVPWLGSTCGRCHFCSRGKENLCPKALFTGYTLDGGFAEYTVADERYCFPISPAFKAEEAAPLLCAGLIGYRSLLKAGQATTIGVYGFGSAANLLTQVATYQGRDVYAFTRPGDVSAQEAAKRLGVAWAGGSDELPPVGLEAAIVFAPVGSLVPQALRAVEPGGTVVCGGIHMSEIPAFPYSILWEERSVCSVANLTRRDWRGVPRAGGRDPCAEQRGSLPPIGGQRRLRSLTPWRAVGNCRTQAEDLTWAVSSPRRTTTPALGLRSRPSLMGRSYVVRSAVTT